LGGIVAGMAAVRRDDLIEELAAGRWRLERARDVAARIASHPAKVRRLMAAMFGDDMELRKRASDVAHRISDDDVEVLWPYADELAGLLAELAPGESRTRWHMGLVVARVAHTREQRLRAARLMQLLFEDESNVARCSAVQGLAVLAMAEPQLRAMAMEHVERALRNGTPAMKARARHAKAKLRRFAAEVD